MLIGEYQHVVDDKGRVIIPTRLREQLGDRFVVTRGLDRCLFAYPLTTWEQLGRRLNGLSFTQADVRAFSRLFFSGAVECILDKQGRASLPTVLRDYAELEKEIVLVGVADRLEIWSSVRWRAYADSAQETFETIAERLTAPDLHGPNG